MQKLDDTVFNTLAEFQIVANRAAEIEKQCAAKKLSEEVKNRQLQSLTIANGSRVEDYALAFTLPCYDDIELIQGGKDREVLLENAQDYVDLVLHFTFHETVKLQVQAFRKGFNAIFPIASLAPFTHSSSQDGELEAMVCGSRCSDAEWQNREELLKHIAPDHGYTRQSEQYLNFIRYITELEPDRRPGFLKFLTGSKRLPLGGFKGLSPQLTLVLKRENPGQHPDQILPSVMACQNYVKSPRYSSYAVLKARFDYATLEGQ
jgi:E3 ubiquitin-protein ligase TRIP12